MKYTIVFLILVFGFLSCNYKNEYCYPNNDLVNYTNIYNSTIWRPYLEKRKPTDSLLQEKLLLLSIIVGDFSRDAIDASGGFLADGGLSNPNSKILITENELSQFYSKIDLAIDEIGKEEKYSLVYEELNNIFHYNFFSSNGSLSRQELLEANIGEATGKLFVIENICYFLIIKYT